MDFKNRLETQLELFLQKPINFGFSKYILLKPLPIRVRFFYYYITSSINSLTRRKYEKKKSHKWKVFGFSILGIFILLIAGFGYEYYQLQPKNHFNSVPVVGPGKKTTNEKTSIDKVEKINDPVFNLLMIGSDERKGDNIGHSD